MLLRVGLALALGVLALLVVVPEDEAGEEAATVTAGSRLASAAEVGGSTAGTDGQEESTEDPRVLYTKYRLDPDQLAVDPGDSPALDAIDASSPWPLTSSGD